MLGGRGRIGHYVFGLVSVVDDIPPLPSGKYRYAISHVAGRQRAESAEPAQR